MPLLGNLPDTIDGLLGSATGGASADTSGALDVSQSPTLGLDALVETSPTVALGVSDLVGLSVSAPTAVGVSADVGQLDVGGLLNGLV
jgi:hypothetical protein